MSTMSLRERLAELTKLHKKKPICMCGINVESHDGKCTAEYSRRIIEVGHPFDEDRIELAMRVIPEIWMHAKSFPSSGDTSYRYKSELQIWLQQHTDRFPTDNHGSFTNGNFIAAMLLLGFEWRVDTRAPKNVRFKLRYLDSKGRRDRSRSPKRGDK